ncbi:MAG: hypothetical protein ACRDWT_11515 [Jatrophihabitantaceae bacterium]
MSTTHRHQVRIAPAARTRRTVEFGGAVAIAVIAVVVVGGYGFGWKWTGLSSSVTLWDWLQVLALPIGLAVGPLLWRHRERMTRRHHTVIGTVLVAFAVLVLTGYLVPMSWTGFTGNTLWNWLELTLLPLVVAFAALWADLRALHRKHVALGAAVLVTFAVLVICGYLVPWSWTGFTGNTMWDWIKLLLLPILVPIVLVPAVTSRMAGRLGGGDRDNAQA